MSLNNQKQYHVKFQNQINIWGSYEHISWINLKNNESFKIMKLMTIDFDS